MTIDEAIEILENICRGLEDLGDAIGAHALKLGIEALKQLQREREQKVGFWRDRLPGETED